MDELTKEFLAESVEGLDRMDQCLTELEQRPRDPQLLGEIFRSVHTIKGTTGFLGFARLERLAHAGEGLLGSLRDGRVTANERVVGGLLQLMDGLRKILRLIEVTGGEGTRVEDDDSALIELMKALDRGDAAVTAAARSEGVPAGLSVSGSAAAATEKTLRVEVEVLNRMMNLVAELVLTRNQILQSQGASDKFAVLGRRLNSVTADLRETVMQARMQPVGHLFSKFPRMVRDLALQCGKCVRIEFSGQETGLDKALLEAIRDPLTHAVRNAIDHGIEEPNARLLAGKQAEGVVRLRAFHYNGWVVIEVEDDGGGISTARVIAKAAERGLVTEEEAAAMTEQKALQLIFEPGFSTASVVTNISGRGVGLDVVRANIEKVGGAVELESKEGEGTRLRLRVPLTMAILRALVVRSGGQSFCVAQSSLTELAYVPWRDVAKTVEWIGDAELFRLRETLLPMVRLDRMLGLKDETGSQTAHGFYLAVLESDGSRYGLVVDDLLAPEEIVVKPLSPVLREIGLFSGATMLGNESLAMILDVNAVGARAGVKPEKVEANAGAVAPAASASFLVYEDRVRGGCMQRKALPLGAVVRIESVALGDVEYAGQRPVLQYRGELLPLEDGGGLLAELMAGDMAGFATVLICRRSGAGTVGMVVGRVLEVADGDVLEADEEICVDRIAKVHDRVMVVHPGWATDGGTLREVA